MSYWTTSAAGTQVLAPDSWPTTQPYDGPAVGPSASSGVTPPPIPSGTGSATLADVEKLLNGGNLGAMQGAFNNQGNYAAGLTWSQLLGTVTTDPSQLKPGALTLPAMLALGNINGKDTLEKQIATGFVDNKPTTGEQGVMAQVINDIMSANNSPANPFTYLSKLQGISNLGPVANFLRGAFTGATGQTPAQLAQQQTVLNSQLAPYIYGNLFTQGQPLNGAGPGSAGFTGGGAAQQTSSPQTNNSPLANLQAAAQNMSGAPLSSAAMQAHLPTGWGTSGQGLAKLNSPSLVGAFTDAIQNAGGQNPQDFMAGVQASMPEFQRSGNAAFKFSGF